MCGRSTIKVRVRRERDMVLLLWRRMEGSLKGKLSAVEIRKRTASFVVVEDI